MWSLEEPDIYCEAGAGSVNLSVTFLLYDHTNITVGQPLTPAAFGSFCRHLLSCKYVFFCSFLEEQVEQE